MTPDEAIRFRELFNHWASSSVQAATKNGDYSDGSQHQFIAWLLSHRPTIIQAVEAHAGIQPSAPRQVEQIQPKAIDKKGD